MNVAAAAIVLFLLVIGQALGILRPITTAVARIAAPVYGAGAGVRRFFDGAFGPTQDAAALAETVDRLTVENAQLKELAAENESLKAALHYGDRAADGAVAARVIAEIDDGETHGLLIDRGSDDGIAAGQPVIVGDGVIIGKIDVVKNRTALALLLSDSKSRLAVSIQNANDTLGVLEGDRGLSMAIKLIAQTEPIQSGNVIVTSGAEAGVQRGLVVGTVDTVVKNTQDPFQSATVAPFQIWMHQPFVQILTGGG